ncbi:conserved exported hypothetical protein [Candidatus Zixiibacteriota bacterium]|nr:conserved exported hypothetical protein [candidate division Zixibacteria bacterium]
MKKRIVNVIFLILFTGPLFPSFLPAGTTPSDDKAKILTTFFPLYLFTRNIMYGIDGVTVENMLPSSYGCPHDFALAPDDLRKIHQADIIIENGLGLEVFMQEAVRTGNNRAHVMIATAGVEPIKLRYYDVHEGSRDDSLLQFNPHAFASPREAGIMVRTITDSLTVWLPRYAEQIRINGNRYAAGLDSLDREFSDSLRDLQNPKVATVHEVLNYMARDYGFDIVDVIEREPGQDPSAKTMVSLVAELRQAKIAAIFSEPQYSTKAVETISAELRVPTYEVDPIASGPDKNLPLDYYQRQMKKNLTALLKAMK